MDTLHTVLKHGAMYSDFTAFPQELFDARLTAVRRAMAECGDDAWIVYGDAQGYAELAYITHFLPRLRSTIVLVTPDRDPVLLTCVGSRDIPATQFLTWITDIRPYWRLPEAMPQFMADTGLTSARVGLVGVRRSMPVGEWDAIRQSLPDVRWAFRDAEFERVREPDDVTARGIRHAAAVVDEGLRAAATAFREHPTFRTAAAEVERVVRRLAAEDVRILVGSVSPSAYQLRPPDDSTIATERALPVFLACEVQRCWAEGAITLPGTSNNPEDVRLAAIAERAVSAMAARVAPDTPAGGVWEAAMRALEEPDLGACAATYGLGHGIGFDTSEAPEILESGTSTFASCSGVALHVVLQNARGTAAAGTTIVRSNGGFSK